MKAILKIEAADKSALVKNAIISVLYRHKYIFWRKTNHIIRFLKNMNLLDRIPTRKPRTKKEMIEYLSNHFRYHTLRSWNRMTSYAHNVKIYNLPWKSKDDESKAYDLVSTAQAARVVQKASGRIQPPNRLSLLNHQ